MDRDVEALAALRAELVSEVRAEVMAELRAELASSAPAGGAPSPVAAATGTMQYGATNDAGTTPTLLTGSGSSPTLTVGNSGSGAGLESQSSAGTAGRFLSIGSIGALGVTGVPSGLTRPPAAGLIGDTSSGVGVVALSASGSGLQAASTVGNGVQATSTSGIGVYGGSTSAGGTGTGVFGETAGNGVAGAFQVANATGRGIAVRAVGNHAQLLLAPYAGTRSAPTGDAKAHGKGELVIDSAGDLWSCTVSGTPGTWRKLSGPATAGQLHVLPAPVRVYDSRAGTLPAVGTKAKLAANVACSVDGRANASGVPAGATAILVNLLVLNAPDANANLTIWADGVAKPSANTMVWGGSSGRFSTTTLTALSASGSCQVAASVSTDVALDVVAYYR